MRLIALALSLAPMPAFAQSAPAPTALQQVGAWSQRLIAVQQPVVEAYARCAPTVEAITAVLRQPPARRVVDAALERQMTACVGDTKAAATQVAADLRAMPPMPAAMEQQLNIDSRAILKSSGAATEGMVAYLTHVEEMLRAALAGDEALVIRKSAEARQSAGSASDAQIVILESLRRSLPMAVHKAMIDVRLGLARSSRLIMIHDPASGWSDLGAQLQGQAAAVRGAAAQIRRSWAAHRKEMQAALARGANPQLRAMVATFDKAFADMAAEGDAYAALVQQIPANKMDEAEALNILNAGARAEINLVQAANAMASAIQR